MTMVDVAGVSAGPSGSGHTHMFLGKGHEQAERRTWAVIWLCAAMMALEIVGGMLFGSIALVADGLHMSTHAGALLLAALAYRYARAHAGDARFSFGTGKLGDLAGFTSAVVLAMIALLIGYEAVRRLFAPVPIHFDEAVPIAGLGLLVNIGSVWLLSGGRGHHGHSHGHAHGADHDHASEHRIDTRIGPLVLSVFEVGAPPRFRIRTEHGAAPAVADISIETERSGGVRQMFTMTDRGSYLESADEIPEPHDFIANLRIGTSHGMQSYPLAFREHGHGPGGAAGRDNNMRAAVIHVTADAAVSVLVIVGLLLARTFGWLWMDPLAGIVGACVIASWAYGLVRDTGAILLDMNPDRGMTEKVRAVIEAEGDELVDLHLWRLGPGHLAAIVSVITGQHRDAGFYHDRLAGLRGLSHLTVEVRPIP